MNFIDQDCLSFFDGDDANAELATFSINHVSNIYPIYVMLYYHGGESLTEEQIQYFDLLRNLVEQYHVDITLVVNEQDVQILQEYNVNNCFKYLIHSCYDSKDELSNNISKIKNFILKSAASRFGNRNISWVFLLEEGVNFYRKIKEKYVECNTPKDIFIFLCMWQYLSTKKAYTDIEDENNIGLTGICSVIDSDVFSKIPAYKNINFYLKDRYLCSKALLINLSECNRKHIEFDLMNDVLEDVDFNINMFANGLHVIALAEPLAIDSSCIKEYRSKRKLSNMTLNLWAKWGDKVVQNLVVEDNQIKPRFVSNFCDIIDEFNSSSKHRMTWPKNERLVKEYMMQKKKMHGN